MLHSAAYSLVKLGWSLCSVGTVFCAGQLSCGQKTGDRLQRARNRVVHKLSSWSIFMLPFLNLYSAVSLDIFMWVCSRACGIDPGMFMLLVGVCNNIFVGTPMQGSIGL